jgi:hypothetical protein
MPILDAGLDQAEKATEQIRADRPKIYYRPENLVIKDGDTRYLHFITAHTAVVSANCHQFMPTKAKPEQFTGSKWPSMMWAICQNDKMYRLRDEGGTVLDEYEPGYGNCYLCTKYKGVKDPKYGKDRSWTTYLTFGLAVPQIPVGADGQPVKDGKGAVAFADEMVRVKDGKEIVEVPKIVIVGQRYEPLWAPVRATAYVAPNTILDKVFLVQRRGQQDKDWNVAASAFTPDCQPGTDHWKRYDQAIALLGFDLQEWFLGHGEKDHYDRWFIEGAIPKDGYARRDGDDEDEDQSGTGTAAATSGAAAVDPARLDGFRASLSARGAAAAQPIQG